MMKQQQKTFASPFKNALGRRTSIANLFALHANAINDTLRTFSSRSERSSKRVE